ncbi:MAG TPA: ATP synthase F1 subunit epsilon [Bryobacteraceae bacterium]|jgi:F-type H+-transporting ATPase subunit epsilon|nr:ATP synthase F1 subunit epsilon [Bryobacteraceae bacterium]
MADTFQLEVATPERLFVDEQVSEAELPGKEGYMGILPGHAPLLSILGAGVLSYKTGGGEQVLALDGGFVEVFEDHVRVLAEHAEFGRDIQADAARQQLQSANEALRNAQETADSEAALRAVSKAQARLDAAERSSGRAQT